MTGLASLVARVAELRRARDANAERIAAFEAEFHDAYAEAYAERVAVKAALDEAETQLKGAALAHYKETKNKSPAPGVTIKVGRLLHYKIADALAWARETGLALVPESVDEKALAKIALATALPFVTILDDPKATLASDLDAALAADPDPVNI